MEIWKDIVGYEGWYQVSNLGRVKSVSRVVPHKTKGGGVSNQVWPSKILRPTVTNHGYQLVVLSKQGKFRYPTIHRLVATAFVPKPFNKPTVNHKDGNKENNMADNLEWCTSSENNYHAWETGLKSRHHRPRETANEK